ncbi:high affinity immunoglobulin epsilon receptor subunit gamma-like isoform X2 [Paramormyrops kingsleyae]|uniref:high affinity immunoglobulin epsilon receptor subunit gamma-like isoform X2 n=1 Tax=Paramormyrops kingsleyae TaxID=1676925 RepID=UPI000CD646DA|nr:high affinity immunoglobulin epsilon receptor subunit gamma-like isoform X2 [Paramormyrops kingsleyae]
MKNSFCFTVIFLLWTNLASADALETTNICYVLDGILFVYGVTLTVLYWRLKIKKASTDNGRLSQKNAEGEGIYTGLTCQNEDTYETIEMKKKGMV